jgi:hypothetical protein
MIPRGSVVHVDDDVHQVESMIIVEVAGRREWFRSDSSGQLTLICLAPSLEILTVFEKKTESLTG